MVVSGTAEHGFDGLGERKRERGEKGGERERVSGGGGDKGKSRFYLD